MRNPAFDLRNSLVEFLKRCPCPVLTALQVDRLQDLCQADAFVESCVRDPKLLDGYLLDAIECLDGPLRASETLLAAVEVAQRSRRASPGLGEDVRLRGDEVVGSGLELDGELIQLCAFSSERTAATTRIRRPSRRR